MSPPDSDDTVPIPPLFVSPRAKWIGIAGLLGLLALAGAGMVLFDYSVGTVLDPEAIRETVEAFGILAPLAFVALQVAQVIIAPIPGQVLALAGGYVFGPLLGTVYSLIGATIGSAIAFWLSRHFGRPAVERLIHPETLSTVDGFLEDHGRLAVFLVFLLPGLPDDALCFVCGLTSIPLRNLVVLSFLGRIPGYALLALAGGRFATHRPIEAALILGFVSVVAFLGYWQRNRILAISVGR
ncbi:MAG: TVP38/TMEM64 family protein [Halodesulfurarchaeum sp.]|nr:TVP38/TMEM64 family protein [Halodesulfurarchaeum sp.]